MPKITKAGFIFGGSYGEGVLKIGGAPETSTLLPQLHTDIK